MASRIHLVPDSLLLLSLLLACGGGRGELLPPPQMLLAMVFSLTLVEKETKPSDHD